jgi:glutamine---fructose-6-phosphate transaminase (isomerizing)
MCGIVGMVGSTECADVLLSGLRRLEYRGYDSAGISTIQDGDIVTRRKVGKLDALAQDLKARPLQGETGIGHTRWATHGVPSEVNAHPHRYGDTVVVHNGIIENHRILRERLKAIGHEFASDTDSEVLAHLVEEQIAKGRDLIRAVQAALLQLEGSFAVALMHVRYPKMLVVAREKSPLVVGLGDGENYVASDAPALLGKTRRFLFLEDGELGVITPGKVNLMSLMTLAHAYRASTLIKWTADMVEKDGYRHFMLKEIHEQPQRVADTFSAHLDPWRDEVSVPELSELKEAAQKWSRVSIIACGTSYHAGMLGKWYIENLAGIPCDVEIASEYRYRNPIVQEHQLAIAVSQSGETADTLAASKEAQKRGADLLAICNSLGSTLTRDAGATMLTLAGPEIGVASTKAFTCQVAVFYVFALWLAAERKKLSDEQLREHIGAAVTVPELMEQVLKQEDHFQEVARKHLTDRSMLYLGRGLAFAIALEGALKLKELSYIHAEGYAAGEMKHGPIALVEESVTSLFVAPEGEGFSKILSNIEEIRSRNGPVIAVTTEGNTQLEGVADDIFYVPAGAAALRPLLTVLPLQLFAYHVANLKGCDVDQPRNLAKSVTVE